MNGVYDVLVIGGPEIPGTSGSIGVRQVPCTFAGLAEAYRLLPVAKAVVYCPQLDIYDDFPAANDISVFDADTPLVSDGARISRLSHRIVVDLGLISTSDQRSIPDQVTETLRAIQDDDVRREGFVQRAALTFIKAALAGLYNVVRHGGTAAFCVPEDYPSWSPEQRRLLSEIIPGVQVYTSKRWMDQLVGEPKMMDILGERRSGLVFGLADGVDSGRQPLFASDLVPEDARVEILDGVCDRTGAHRLLTARVEDGQMLLCSGFAWKGLLTRLGITDRGDREQVEQIDGRRVPSSLSAWLDRSEVDVDKWDQIVGWGANDNRRGALRSLRDVAALLDALPPKKIHDPSASLQIPGTDREIKGASLRRRLDIKRASIPADAPRLRKFLDAAKDAYQKRFRAE